MIRILHVVTKMERAGLESRLMDIYRNIDREKIQYDFYTNRWTEGEFDKEILSLGGKVFYSNPILIGKEHKKISEFELFLKEHEEYRIIHAHVNEWCALFCIGAKRANVPNRIAHAHGANKTFSIKTLYKNIIKRFINRNATHFLAVSKEAGINLFGKEAYDSGKVLVYPNAITTNNFRFNAKTRERIRNDLGLEDSLAIFHVGNLLPVKNHLFLLNVFTAVKANNTKSKLILVGEGEQRSVIERFVENNGLNDSVIILGKRADVPQLLQAADCFVFPSFHEGFPGAVLEAEASGLPCIISDTITDEVVITNKVKKMSLSLSPEAWAKVIINAIEPIREDCVDNIVSAGYDIVDLSKKMMAFYEELYL